MKMYQIMECKKFYEELKNKKLPIRVAYKLNKLFKSLEEEALFYQEKFAEVIQEFGLKDENGNFILTEDQQGIRIKEDKISECELKIQELARLDVEITDISFSLEELDSLELTVKEIEWLAPFIKA